MKNQPKLAIMASLDTMDGIQAEKVLMYIKDMLDEAHRREMEYSRVKREALKEIRQALDVNDVGFSTAI
jgi:excinuclease UvrABC nuclease subunit